MNSAQETLALARLALTHDVGNEVTRADAVRAIDMLLSVMEKPAAWINWSAMSSEPRLGWECASEIASEPLFRGLATLEEADGYVHGYHVGINAALPLWINYNPMTDVLRIHGRNYSAAMFGETGFLSPAGTVLRIEKSSDDVVTVTECRPLSDQRIDEVMQPLTTKPYSWREFARAIENDHGIKVE